MEKIEIAGKLDLEQMKSVDVCAVGRENLTDITDIQINKNLPQKERFMEFLEQIKNPYCYRCGKVVVKVSFSDTDMTLEKCLQHYIESLSG